MHALEGIPAQQGEGANAARRLADAMKRLSEGDAGSFLPLTGVGGMVEAAMMGVLLMLFFRRSGALWPVVLGHYLTNIVDFA